MAEDYEREKLGNAVDALASSAAPIQRRLENAFLAMHTLLVHGFTDTERQAEFEEICRRLTTDPSGSPEISFSDVCAKLRDAEAEELARSIVDLNTRLHHDRIYALEDALENLKRR